MGKLSYVVNSIWNEDSNRSERILRLAYFAGWQIWKRTASTPITVRLFNGHRIQVWPDCDSSASAVYYCVPDSLHISFLRKHLTGGVFVDVGANVGLLTLLVADKIGHAILFEPNPIASDRARQNLKLNGLSYDVFQLALSDTDGTVLVENSGPSSCNRTVKGFSATGPTIPVTCARFDNFIRTYPGTARPIDVIKIDVEGHENSVLLGMTGFLAEHRPKLIMFEYLARTNIMQTISIFHRLQYSVFELTASGRRKITSAAVNPLQDLFACPDERCREFGL